MTVRNAWHADRRICGQETFGRVGVRAERPAVHPGEAAESATLLEPMLLTLLKHRSLVA